MLASNSTFRQCRSHSLHQSASLPITPALQTIQNTSSETTYTLQTTPIDPDWIQLKPSDYYPITITVVYRT